MRLLMIAIATIFVLALGAFALANRSPQDPADDVIIIRGGSLEVQCPANQGKTCLGLPDVTTGKYKHSKIDNHITKVVVMDSNGAVLFDSSDPKHCGGSALGKKPEIDITYTP
jgi:hypothetical protein